MLTSRQRPACRVWSEQGFCSKNGSLCQNILVCNCQDRKLLPKSEQPHTLIGVFRGLRVVFSARDRFQRFQRRRNKFPTVWRGVSRLHKSSFGFFVKIYELGKEMVQVPTLGEWTFKGPFTQMWINIGRGSGMESVCSEHFCIYLENKPQNT